MSKWEWMVAWKRCVILVVTKSRWWRKTEKTGDKRPCALIFFLNVLPKKPEIVRLGMICVQIEDRHRLMLILCSRSLPPLAGANCVSPWPVNNDSRLQSSELSLHDLIHCSSIGRVLKFRILLEWRLLPWCVAEVAAGPNGSFYCLIW